MNEYDSLYEAGFVVPPNLHQSVEPLSDTLDSPIGLPVTSSTGATQVHRLRDLPQRVSAQIQHWRCGSSNTLAAA